MGLLLVLIEAVALSADAFAVSVCKGLSMRRVDTASALLCGLWFGGFQGLMPFLGYLLGAVFERYVRIAAPVIAFAILVFIGAKMIRESFVFGEKADPRLDAGTMLAMSVATSIDAFAVGVAFAMEPIVLNERMPPLLNVLCICAVICLVTFTVCFAGVGLGNVFGSKHKSKAELAGGIVLIIIAFWGLIR